MMGTHPIELRFDAQQVITMAQRLPVREIEALGECTDLREAGLRAARAGELVVGARLVGEARANIERVELGEEAATMFETYQLAAESYLDYRNARCGAAAQRMRGAIAHANKLRTRYGYVVELRRIHLAANLVRIEVQRGHHGAALEGGLGLLDYIAGAPDAWPWRELGINDPDRLSADARLFVVDQVLRPLNTAIAKEGLAAHSAASRLNAVLKRLRTSDRPDPLCAVIERWVAVTLQR